MAGGSSNPMQAHHRKQRKKEAERNKKQRIKARDERVVETKTVSGIREEIKKLKYRKNLQSGEKQKLERLEKELKLVKEAAPQRPNKALQLAKQQKLPTDLDDPRKSIYYDEKLNPYGAPPPGKPRLYHQRGGGVTMDMKMAIVPGEESQPPPPPPPPPPQPTERREQRESRPIQRESPKSRTPSPPRMSSSPPEEATSSEPKSLIIPSLPAPSKAVQRSRRHGKIAADIWASNEEVEYERYTNKVDLEADDVGAAAPKKKTKKKKTKKKLPLEYHYQDMSGQVQGPYGKTQMREWISAGFFPPTMLVKSNRNDQWVPMKDVQSLQEPSAAPSKREEEETLQDRISALKKQQEENSVQDRIAALKGNNIVSKEVDEQKSSSIQDRINALKGSNNNMNSKAEVEGENDSDEMVQPVDDEDQSPSIEEMLPPHNASDDEVAPGPDKEQEDEITGPAPYPIEEEYPTVAPYPVDNQYPAVSAYPVDAEYPEAAPYPVDDEYPAASPYPVDDEYPATDEYPVSEDYPPPEPYPPTEPYEAGPAPYEMQDQPVKKTITVDKGVVAFLPSKIQKRKRQGAPSIEEGTKRKKLISKETTNDEYDKFMKEIDGL